MKEGDRVRIINNDDNYHNFAIGMIGTVTRVSDIGDYLVVSGDSGHQYHQTVRPKHIELVKTEGGLKHDDDKLPLHLLSFPVLEGVAAVLRHGAKKYAPRNWELGLAYSRPFAATLRHMSAYWQGEEHDKETGLSHLDHAICELMFLSHFVKQQRTDLDDRPVNRSETRKDV